MIRYTGVESAYGGWYGSYGASHSMEPNFITCEGTITSVWDWNPDLIEFPANSGEFIPDPLDTPPEWVVVAEYCIAKYSAYHFIPGSMSGTCDNGLGFSMTRTYDELYMYPPDGDPHLIGWVEWGESKGTRYKKVAGQETITLTCTPGVSVQVNNGMCFAEVRYGVSIMVPRVELLGTTRFLNPHAVKFLPGQRIRATIGMPNPYGLPPALAVDPESYRWSLSNDGVEAFKDYVTGTYLGKKYPLLDHDKRQSVFNFYTNKNGETQVVCDFKFVLPGGARFEGGLPDFQVKSKAIHSVRPEYVDSEVVPNTNATGGVILREPDDFIFFDPLEGQEWKDVQFSVPLPFSQVGEGRFVQLITADRNIYRTVTNPLARTRFRNIVWSSPILWLYGTGQEALDTSFPPPQALAPDWNLPDKGRLIDSPSQKLFISSLNYTAHWFKATAIDSFQTWALYKPPQKDGQPTVWIPIVRYKWTWGGVAERIPYPSGQWILSSFSGQVTQQPAPTSDFPEWERLSNSPIQFKSDPP